MGEHLAHQVQLGVGVAQLGGAVTHAALQFAVDLVQLTLRGLQQIEHAVEGAAQPLQFVAGADLDALAHVAGANGAHPGGQLQHGAGHRARQQQRRGQGHQHGRGRQRADMPPRGALLRPVAVQGKPHGHGADGNARPLHGQDVMIDFRPVGEFFREPVRCRIGGTRRGGRGGRPRGARYAQCARSVSHARCARCAGCARSVSHASLPAHAAHPLGAPVGRRTGHARRQTPAKSAGLLRLGGSTRQGMRRRLEGPAATPKYQRRTIHTGDHDVCQPRLPLQHAGAVVDKNRIVFRRQGAGGHFRHRRGQLVGLRFHAPAQHALLIGNDHAKNGRDDHHPRHKGQPARLEGDAKAAARGAAR